MFPKQEGPELWYAKGLGLGEGASSVLGSVLGQLTQPTQPRSLTSQSSQYCKEEIWGSASQANMALLLPFGSSLISYSQKGKVKTMEGDEECRWVFKGS